MTRLVDYHYNSTGSDVKGNKGQGYSCAQDLRRVIRKVCTELTDDQAYSKITLQSVEFQALDTTTEKGYQSSD